MVQKHGSGSLFGIRNTPIAAFGGTARIQAVKRWSMIRALLVVAQGGENRNHNPGPQGDGRF